MVDVIDIADLDDLQIVTKRECRRGYPGQIYGVPMFLRYRKLMRLPNGQLVVCRRPFGREKKAFRCDLRRTLALTLIAVWPATLLGVAVGANLLVRALV